MIHFISTRALFLCQPFSMTQYVTYPISYHKKAILFSASFLYIWFSIIYLLIKTLAKTISKTYKKNQISKAHFVVVSSFCRHIRHNGCRRDFSLSRACFVPLARPCIYTCFFLSYSAICFSIAFTSPNDLFLFLCLLINYHYFFLKFYKSNENSKTYRLTIYFAVFLHTSRCNYIRTGIIYIFDQNISFFNRAFSNMFINLIHACCNIS